MTLETLFLLFLALFVSTAVHEYGHAAMARLVKLPIAQILVGMPEIGFGFRSKRFGCPVTIGPLPFYGHVRLRALEPRQRSLVTAFALAGPMASLVLGWTALGALFVFYQGFAPAFLALGAVLLATAVIFTLRPTGVLGWVIPAAIVTMIGFVAWAVASFVSGPVTAPSDRFVPEMLRLIGIVSSVTGVVNLTTVISKLVSQVSDGKIVERQGGKYAGHVRYLDWAAIGGLAVILLAALVTAFA